MNDDVIFERNAQAWLESGPEKAPRRVVDAALLAIDSMPQQRALRVPWRFPRMTSQARLFSVAAVGLIVIVAGAYMFQNRQSQVAGPGPSQSPTTNPVPSPSLTVSAALQATWAVVGTRPWPDGSWGEHSTFDLGPSVLRIPQAHVDVDSKWSLTDNNSLLQLDFQGYSEGLPPSLPNQRWDCTIGQIGVYSFSLSADGAALFLSEVSDPCAPRAAILAGNWDRTPCHNWERQICLGPLSEGRHVAPYFKPFDSGTQGQLAYTVPAGWAQMYIPPTWTQDLRTTQMTLWRRSALGDAAVDVYANVTPSSATAVRDSPPIVCPQAVSPSAQTATQIAGWLASRPYLSVTSPTPVSIGGLSGVFVDVSVVPGWVDPCAFNEESDGTRQYDSTIWVFQSTHDQAAVGLDRSGNGRARYILLDRGGGQALLIAVQGSADLNWESLVADSMAVVQSFEFHH